MKTKLLSVLVFAVLLAPIAWGSGPEVIASNIEHRMTFAQDNFEINSPANLTFYKDSIFHAILWTVINSTPSIITYEVLRNGTSVHTGVVANHSAIYQIPIHGLNYGTYNYTILVTDGVETESASVIVWLLEGTANTANPWLAVLALPLIMVGFGCLIWIGDRMLN